MPSRRYGNVVAWASILDQPTLDQARTTASLPIIHGHLALMADAHLGMGATIGSVIPTRGAIIPSAVGVDIGCGMVAAETSLTSHDLPDDLGDLLDRLEDAVPAGMGRAHQTRESSPEWERFNARYGWPQGSGTDEKQRATAHVQFGTLGSGNHFMSFASTKGTASG